MSKKSKKTLYYEKQQKRLQRNIRKFEKRGYDVEKIIGKSRDKITHNYFDNLLSSTKENVSKGKSPKNIQRTRNRSIARVKKESEIKEKRKRKIGGKGGIGKQPAYPTISIIDVIRDRIMELPNERFIYFSNNKSKGWIEISPYKNMMISFLDDAVANADDISNLEKYYIEIQYELLEKLTLIETDSDGDRVKGHIAEATQLLKGSPLTLNESAMVSEYVESLNGF